MTVRATVRRANAARTALALVAAAGAAFAGGCGSTCVKKDQRIGVRLVATPDLNDVGGGPQHVQFRAWAVRDRAVWESLAAEVLAGGEVSMLVAQGLGTSFPTESSWLRPGYEARSFLAVTDDLQYSAVGVAVLYPAPRKALVALDCARSAGYVVENNAHQLTFTLERADVRPGEPK